MSFPSSRSAKPLDGRVILMLSRDFTREPRSHVMPNEPLASPYLFGLTVDGLAPGSTALVNDSAFGWPERLESLQPKYEGSAAYGDRAELCWNGDPTLPNAYSRLHYDSLYLPVILQRIAAPAPRGADLKSWRY